MKPEDKVCTLEQAKRLVELGVVLETEKYWCDLKPWQLKQRYHSKSLLKKGVILPAPDVAELGDILPVEIWENDKCIFQFDDIGKLDTDCYVFNRSKSFLKTEAQSRCATLIWLIENGHVKPNGAKI